MTRNSYGLWLKRQRSRSEKCEERVYDSIYNPHVSSQFRYPHLPYMGLVPYRSLHHIRVLLHSYGAATTVNIYYQKIYGKPFATSSNENDAVQHIFYGIVSLFLPRR